MANNILSNRGLFEFHHKIGANSSMQDYAKMCILLSTQPPVERSTIILLKVPKRFTVAEHSKIIHTLMIYGYTDPNDFALKTNLKPNEVETYVQRIIKYCQASQEERKLLKHTIAEKIHKYNVQKILTRIELFKNLRAASPQLYSGEELEFYHSLSTFGLTEAHNSPILQSICSGNPTETKLSSKLKQFAEHKHSSLRSMFNIDMKMPLRINEMMIIRNFGKLSSNPNFYDFSENKQWIYPIGYRICTGIDINGILKWVEFGIDEKDNQPLFFARNYQESMKQVLISDPEIQLENNIDDLQNETELNQENLNEAFYYEGNTPEEVINHFQNGYPFDAKEIFGLSSAIFHRGIQQLPGIDLIPDYQKWWFQNDPISIHEWPILGKFEKEYEKEQLRLKFKKQDNSKYPKSPNLVINLRSLFNEMKKQENEGGLIDFEGSDNFSFKKLVPRYISLQNDDL